MHLHLLRSTQANIFRIHSFRKYLQIFLMRKHGVSLLCVDVQSAALSAWGAKTEGDIITVLL